MSGYVLEEADQKGGRDHPPPQLRNFRLKPKASFPQALINGAG
jgi:hypothetical protein